MIIDIKRKIRNDAIAVYLHKSVNPGMPVSDVIDLIMKFKTLVYKQRVLTEYENIVISGFN